MPAGATRSRMSRRAPTSSVPGMSACQARLRKSPYPQTVKRRSTSPWGSPGCPNTRPAQMRSLLSKSPLRFQAKVLIPVIAIMATLVIATVWVVNQRIVHQLETEGAHRLETAEAIFQNSLKIRANYLLLRYRNAADDPGFRALSQLGDPKTMHFSLATMLDELNVDALLFT